MNDLISKQAVLDIVDDLRDRMTVEGYWSMVERVKALPSAQPERKTGRWIDDNCSKCGQYVYHGDVRNFCPNCGAHMMEGEG